VLVTSESEGDFSVATIMNTSLLTRFGSLLVAAIVSYWSDGFGLALSMAVAGPDSDSRRGTEVKIQVPGRI